MMSGFVEFIVMIGVTSMIIALLGLAFFWKVIWKTFQAKKLIDEYGEMIDEYRENQREWVRCYDTHDFEGTKRATEKRWRLERQMDEKLAEVVEQLPP